METTLPRLDIPALLRQHRLQPQKSLGQNFLSDPVTLQKIVDAGQVEKTDTVLEIGPGLGSLTRYLALRAARVIAVELDQHLIPILKEVLIPFSNVEIIHGDILQLNPKLLLNQFSGQQSTRNNFPYLVIANIPYYITSAVIRHLLESGYPPVRMVLTVQREVAERICATPERAHKADAQMSLLALSVQVYGQPSMAAHIPASAFYPPPQVDSAVVRVDLYAEPRIPPPWIETFFRLAKAGYGQKRKTLRNAFIAGLSLPKEKIDALLNEAHMDGMRRAETLTIEEWHRLTKTYLEMQTHV